MLFEYSAQLFCLIKEYDFLCLEIQGNGKVDWIDIPPYPSIHICIQDNFKRSKLYFPQYQAINILVEGIEGLGPVNSPTFSGC